MTNVHMGEIAVCAQAGTELVAMGLGSCIGLAIVDRHGGVAGLAHILLPESRGQHQKPGRFADRAVPELVARLRRLGAAPARLEAAIAGGARMFALDDGLTVGTRNEQAVRDALRRAGVRVSAAHTGGQQGRTMRVLVGSGLVTIRVAGAEPEVLLASRCASSASGARSAHLTDARRSSPSINRAIGLTGGR